MTNFTRDVDRINAAHLALTGEKYDYAGVISRTRFGAAIAPDAMLLFTGTRRGRYSVSIITGPDATAASVTSFMNASLRKALIQTDAFVLVGRVPQDRNAMVRIMENIHGATLVSSEGGTNRYRMTLASLAKHYGPQTVIDALVSSGNGWKADRLKAAWDAWKARQP